MSSPLWFHKFDLCYQWIEFGGDQVGIECRGCKMQQQFHFNDSRGMKSWMKEHEDRYGVPEDWSPHWPPERPYKGGTPFG